MVSQVRAQSEVIGIVLLTAVVVILVTVTGAVVLSDRVNEGETRAVIEIEPETTLDGTTLTLAHSGGEAVESDEVRVIVSGGVDGEFFLNAESGPDEELFEAGDSWEFDELDPVEGEILDVIVQYESEETLLEESAHEVSIPDADIEITALNESVTAGDDVEGTYELANTGEGTIKPTTELLINESQETEKIQQLSEDETLTDAIEYNTSEDDKPAIEVGVRINETGVIDTETVTVEEPDDAEFAVALLEEESTLSVNESENITAEANVTNTGEQEDEQELVAEVNGEEQQNTSVDLSGGESSNETLEFEGEAEFDNETLELETDDDADNATLEVDERANLSVEIDESESLLLASEGGDEEQIELVADVTNEGDLQGTQNITATLDDELVDENETTVDAGEAEAVDLRFNVSEDDDGETVTVASENETAETEIEVFGEDVTLLREDQELEEDIDGEQCEAGVVVGEGVTVEGVDDVMIECEETVTFRNDSVIENTEDIEITSEEGDVEFGSDVSVAADEDVQIESSDGSIETGSNGEFISDEDEIEFTADEEVSIGEETTIDATDDVVVEGSSDGSNVRIEIEDQTEIGSDEEALEITADEDVTFGNETKLDSNEEIKIEASDGSFTTGANGEFVSEEDEIEFTADEKMSIGEETTVNATDDVVIEGSSDGSNVRIEIADQAEIESDEDIQIEAEVSLTVGEKIELAAFGAVTLNNDDGSVTVDDGVELVSDGDEDALEITAEDDITFGNNTKVDSDDNVDIEASDGSFTTGANGEFVSEEDEIEFTADEQVSIGEETTINATDDVVIEGSSDGSNVRIEIADQTEIESDKEALEITADEDIVFGNETRLDSDEEIDIEASEGSLTTGSNGKLLAGDDVTVTGDETVTVDQNTTVTAGENVEIESEDGNLTVKNETTITADDGDGDVDLTAEDQLIIEEDVTIEADEENLDADEIDDRR